MILKTCMKKNVFYIQEDATINQAIDIFTANKVGTLPVLDKEKKVIGVFYITDILKIFLPSFIEFIDNIDFIKDFGALSFDENKIRMINDINIKEIMEKSPVVVDEECELMRALSLMKKHNITDLIIVNNENRLLGIASQVDIATRLLDLLRGNLIDNKEGLSL